MSYPNIIVGCSPMSSPKSKYMGALKNASQSIVAYVKSGEATYNYRQASRNRASVISMLLKRIRSRVERGACHAAVFVKPKYRAAHSSQLSEIGTCQKFAASTIAASLGVIHAPSRASPGAYSNNSLALAHFAAKSPRHLFGFKKQCQRN